MIQHWSSPLPVGVNTPGTYIPQGWGSKWRAARALAKAGTGQARIAILGPSIDRGMFASNLDTTSWAGRVKTSLQATYGNGGTGWKGLSDTITWQTNVPGTPTAVSNAYIANGCFWTLAGTWGTAVGSGGPMGNNAVLSCTDNTATATVNVVGTTLRIYVLTGGNAGYSYKIDGAAAVPIADGASGVGVTTVSGLSAGTHAIQLSVPTPAGKTFYPCGIAAENSTGVIVNNFSLPGGTTAMWTSDDFQQSGLWAGGQNYPADLIIYSMGGNDAGSGVSAATAMNNIKKYLDAIRNSTGSNVNQDIMFLVDHIGAFDTAHLWQDYSAGFRQLAESYNAALVNMWTIGKNSWQYWNALNYWGNNANPSIAGTDTVHPSDAGHQQYANAILPLLTI